MIKIDFDALTHLSPEQKAELANMHVKWESDAVAMRAAMARPVTEVDPTINGHDAFDRVVGFIPKIIRVTHAEIDAMLSSSPLGTAEGFSN